MKGLNFRIVKYRDEDGEIIYQLFVDGSLTDETSKLADIFFDIREELNEVEV